MSGFLWCGAAVCVENLLSAALFAPPHRLTHTHKKHDTFLRQMLSINLSIYLTIYRSMHPSTYLVEVAPLSCRRGLFTKPTPRTPPSYSISLSPQVPSQVSHQQSRSSQSRHLQVVKEISLDLKLCRLRLKL